MDAPSQARHEQQFVQFRQLIDALPVASRPWGFIAVRTAYHSDLETDAEQWDRALSTLKEYGFPKAKASRRDRRDPEDFAMPVMNDRDTLDGASVEQLRVDFAAWMADYGRHVAGRTLESGMRRYFPAKMPGDFIVVIDAQALASLLEAPMPKPQWAWQHSWVAPTALGVHTKSPAEASRPIRNGLPYTGWMRVWVPVFQRLHTLVLISDFENEMWPQPRQPDQIPYYDGDDDHKLLVPSGGPPENPTYKSVTARSLIPVNEEEERAKFLQKSEEESRKQINWLATAGDNQGS